MDIQNYLEQYYKGNKDTTLKAMEFFMDEFGHFERKMKFIHIAGTNGKGSTTKIITNILINAGYKVGTFISPHLVRFNERIKINNIEITDREMEDYIVELEPIIKKYNDFADKSEINHITFFELITIIAFLYYYRNNVDFVVLETGLGGLLDSTNIITKPIVSVITSIGYDHTHILGSTLTEIAGQKAGIIKPYSETVIFEQNNEINQVFIDKCKQEGNKIHIIQNRDINNYFFNEEFQFFDFKDFKNLKLNLKGKAQIRNASLALEVTDIIRKQGYQISENAVKLGLSTIINHARMETLSKDPLIIFDGAHNRPAMENFMEMVNMYYPNIQKKYIISILARKEYDEMLKNISKDEYADFIMTSGNDENRYASKEDLYECAKKYIKEQKLRKATLEDAVIDAKKGNEITFIIGSFYVYGTVLKILKRFK